MSGFRLSAVKTRLTALLFETDLLHSDNMLSNFEVKFTIAFIMNTYKDKGDNSVIP